MKRAKKPTRRQKILMAKWGIDVSKWLVTCDTPEEMIIVHRHSDKTVKVIRKGVKKDGKHDE